jgi:hypothetical protein
LDLIKSIKIEGLRSIQDQTLPTTGSLNVFVGKNSSGKSNALRALNVFFNGVIEPDKPIDFSRDHFEQVPRKKKRKRISVEVEFQLPKSFNLRQGLEPLKAFGNQFTIIRYWELDQLRRPYEKLEVRIQGQIINDAENLGRQFLSLITYRYIPNRTVPSAILKDESQAIANSIFGRMKGDQHAAALLHALSDAAERMLFDASKSLSNVGSPLESPSVSTATSIGEMLTMGGFKAKGAHGLSVQDEDWGAGHQAFFLYQVLKTLDTTYSRFFGWKQATIWGVEEPEAALHRELETRLAEQFRSWCFEESARIQLFVTTHSPIFTMAADNGYWTELDQGESKFERLSIPELTRAAETKGVAGWVHPILYFPWNPVVLTEGPIDSEVLSHVAHLTGIDHLKFVCLPELNTQERRGGKDKIIAFLKNSLGLIQNRAREAPLIVLLDWEVSKQDLDKARLAYGPGGDKFVHLMDESNCNSLLGKDFKGIERFYPPEVIVDAHQAGELIVGIQKGKPYSVSQDQLNSGKGALRRRILKIDSIKKLKELVSVVMDLDQIYRQDGHVQLTLPSFKY